MEKAAPKALMQELRKQAKEKGLKGYSTLSKLDLQLLLAGKPVTKKMKKSQVRVGTQTDFRPCDDCGLEALMTHLCFKADAEREIVYDGDMEIDAASGEIVGCGVEGGYRNFGN